MKTDQNSDSVARLEVFRSFLPDGDVQEERVICYHLLLDDLQRNIDQNLNFFRITDEFLIEKDDQIRYCNGWVFRTKLDGALNVLTALHAQTSSNLY